jgi:hypothetical protein
MIADGRDGSRDPQQDRVVRQGVGIALHVAMMNEVIASLPGFVAPDREIVPRVPVCGAAPVRDHSHPSSNAANWAGDSAIRPVMVADGHTNWPRSSRLVNMQSPTPSCQISLISPARRPRKA